MAAGGGDRPQGALRRTLLRGRSVGQVLGWDPLSGRRARGGRLGWSWARRRGAGVGFWGAADGPGLRGVAPVSKLVPRLGRDAAGSLLGWLGVRKGRQVGHARTFAPAEPAER